MALQFGRRLPSIPSKKVRRDVDAPTFLLDMVGGAADGYEVTASVTFMDYNKQTVNYTFEVVGATPLAAHTALKNTVLPMFGITASGNLQGLQMLSYTFSIHQEIGFTDNIQPVYGNQREMFGVIQFPVEGELVEHRFPNPDNGILDPADKRYLTTDAATTPTCAALNSYIALFTSATPTLLMRGKKPGSPQKMFMRHSKSRVQVESVAIG